MFDGSLTVNTSKDLDYEKRRAEIEIWSNQFDKKWAYLDEVEPLPDNFEDICKGKATVPVYSK